MVFPLKDKQAAHKVHGDTYNEKWNKFYIVIIYGIR